MLDLVPELLAFDPSLHELKSTLDARVSELQAHILRDAPGCFVGKDGIKSEVSSRYLGFAERDLLPLGAELDEPEAQPLVPPAAKRARLFGFRPANPGASAGSKRPLPSASGSGRTGEPPPSVAAGALPPAGASSGRASGDDREESGSIRGNGTVIDGAKRMRADGAA